MDQVLHLPGVTERKTDRVILAMGIKFVISASIVILPILEFLVVEKPGSYRVAIEYPAFKGIHSLISSQHQLL